MSNHRPLYEIALEIRKDWGVKLSPHAKPYIDAMRQLNRISEMYYADDARDIVCRFLCNAQTWRGPVARKVKAELNAMLKEGEAR